MTIISQQDRPQPITLKQLAAHFDRAQWITEKKVRVASPLRQERTPSVYLTEAPDGKILIHDFAGDSVVEILNAIGVDIQSLFPASNDHYVKPTKERMAAIDLVRFLKADLNLILIFARMIQRGEVPTEGDFTKLGEIIDRVQDGLNFGGAK